MLDNTVVTLFVLPGHNLISKSWPINSLAHFWFSLPISRCSDKIEAPLVCKYDEVPAHQVGAPLLYNKNDGHELFLVNGFGLHLYVQRLAEISNRVFVWRWHRSNPLMESIDFYYKRNAKVWYSQLFWPSKRLYLHHGPKQSSHFRVVKWEEWLYERTYEWNAGNTPGAPNTLSSFFGVLHSTIAWTLSGSTTIPCTYTMWPL